MDYNMFSYLFKFIVFLNILAFVSCLERTRYDNFRVYNILVQNEKQEKFLKEIEVDSDAFQIIDTPVTTNKNSRLVVPPHKFTEFDKNIKDLKLNTTLLVSNLQKAIDEESKINTRKSNRLDWTRYWKLNEIHSWLKQLVADHPNDLELINIGKSYENRDILGMRLNKHKNSKKKQIVFEGTMHAREWISSATITWMINELITSKNPLIRKLAATYEWNVIPVINVDGYEYSWTFDRLWRKTRRPVNNRCKGADPNRNFDIYHNRTLASACSEIYPGPHPFSEPETKQFSRFVANLDNLVAYFGFHSFGQLLMMPYGYTNRRPVNYDVLYEIGEKAVKSLSVRFGTQYKLGSINEKMGAVAGNSIDWVQEKLNPNLTYVYELRDTGSNGFGLPTSQIIENSLEVFDSIVTIMQEAQKRGIA